MTLQDQQILLHHYDVDMKRWVDESPEMYREAFSNYVRVQNTPLDLLCTTG